MQDKGFKAGSSECVFARIEILAILFCIFVFLCIWPLLSSFGQGSPELLYFYFFGLLICHTCVMIFLARYVGGRSSLEERDLNGEGTCDD